MADSNREYFERGYPQRWGLPAPSDVVRLEASGLCHLLQLSPASCVIDIGCGHGRHAIALAERGPEVIGLDFAVALLSRAQHFTAASGARVHWIRGDMRQLPFRSRCADAAIMLDAFGLFDTEDEHEAVLRETARVIRIGGRLGVKVINGGPVIDHFRKSDREKRHGKVISISRTLTLDPPRLTETIMISGPFGLGEYERRQRLYRVEELCTALKRAGLAIFGVFARPDGTPFDPTLSSTIWIVGQR